MARYTPNPIYKYNEDQARLNEKRALEDATNLTKSTTEFLAEYIAQSKAVQQNYVAAANRGGQVGMFNEGAVEENATTSDLSNNMNPEGTHANAQKAAIRGLQSSGDIKLSENTGNLGGMYSMSATDLNKSLKNEFNQTKNEAIGNIAKMYNQASDYDEVAKMQKIAERYDYEQWKAQQRAKKNSFMGTIIGGAATLIGTGIGAYFGAPTVGAAIGGSLGQMAAGQLGYNS